MFSARRRSSRRLAVLTATLALGAVGAALLASPAAAVPPCPQGKVCTDDNGFYELAVPALPKEGIYATYRDCIWHVHVDFGDGSPPASYVFEGEVGLSGSHTFPHYGEYSVSITLSESHHKANPSGPECLNPPQSAKVLYRDPSKFAEEEQKEAAARAAKEQKEAEERAAKEQRRSEEAAREKRQREEAEAREKAHAGKSKEGNGSGSGSGNGSSEEGEGGGGRNGVLFWTVCHRQVYAHRVPCGRAQKVIKSAAKKLTKPGSAKVAGFSCRYDPIQARPLSCRRGVGRILGPPA